MTRPSVIPQVRLRLEAYLNEREVAYQALPEGVRVPTIPSTHTGKVNVRGVADAIGLKNTYRNSSLRTSIALHNLGELA